MASPAIARLDIASLRNEARTFDLVIRGRDLTGAVLRQQVRLERDAPGAPLIDLGTVTNGNAEGLRLVSVTQEAGLPVSRVRIRYNKSTMQDAAKLPYTGELGDSTRLVHAIQIDGVTRLAGAWWAVASAIDSDGAPAGRVPGYGAAQAPGIEAAGGATWIGDSVIQVTIAGADLVAPLAAAAADSATAAAVEATRASQAMARIQAMLARAGVTTGAQLLGVLDGFALDGSTDVTTLAVKVRGGGKDFEGSFLAWLRATGLAGTLFPNPKRVIDASGRETWSTHNRVYSSDTPAQSFAALDSTVQDGVIAPSGIPSTLVTATASMGRALNDNNSLGGIAGGSATTVGLKLERAFSDYARVNFDAEFVDVDLVRGVVAGKSVGVTAALLRTTATGDPLPNGRFRLELVRVIAGGDKGDISIRPIDAPGSGASTPGAAVYFSEPQFNLGDHSTPYIARGTAAANAPIAVDVPYDWSRGERRIIVDPEDLFRLTTAVLPGMAAVIVDGEFVSPAAGPSNSPVLIMSKAGTPGTTRTVTIRRQASDALPALTAKANDGDPIALGSTEDQTLPSNRDGLCLAVQQDAGGVLFSTNGDVGVYSVLAATGYDALALGASEGNDASRHRLYLRSLVILAAPIASERLSRMLDGQRRHPTVRASATVKTWGQDPNTGQSREPGGCLLSQTNARAEILVTTMQKHEPSAHGEGISAEAPARVTGTRFAIHRHTGIIERLGETVIFEQDAYKNGLGHVQSFGVGKVPSGPHKGELLGLAFAATPPGGVWQGEFTRRALFAARSIDNGRTWSPFVEKLGPEALDGDARFLIGDPSGTIVHFPEGGPYAGRQLMFFYQGRGARAVRAVWTDDAGATMQHGGLAPAVPGYKPNEPAGFMLPNGVAGCFMRVETTGEAEPDDVCYVTLTFDGGQTLTEPIAVPAFRGPQVGGSAVNLDPEGGYGPAGVVAHGHTQSSVNRRSGCRIDLYRTMPGLALLAQIQALPRLRSSGYNRIIPLWGGEQLALLREGSPTGGENLHGSTFLHVIKGLAL